MNKGPMDRQQTEKAIEKLDTTIGELIEAITEIALEAGKTEAEGYHLASLTIETIMRRKSKDSQIFN